MDPSDIVDLVMWNTRVRQVLITGGEPLQQEKGFKQLVRLLSEAGYLVQVETNGSKIPEYFYTWVDCWVVDYKLRSSGQTKKMEELSRLAQFPSPCFLKFVVSTDEDYEQAKALLKRMSRLDRRDKWSLVMSPCAPMTPDALYQKMKADSLMAVLFSLQIHKWGKLDEVREVIDLSQDTPPTRPAARCKPTAMALARWLVRRGAKPKIVKEAFQAYYKTKGRTNKEWVKRHAKKYMGLAANDLESTEPKKGGAQPKNVKAKKSVRKK